jgi:hypothetical protein
VRGILINMMVVGVFAGIVAWLLGLPFALLLAVFAGLTEAIPLVGPWIGAVPVVLLGFSISPTTGFLVILAYLLIQQVENHTLVPLVMNRVVKLNPLTTLVAVTIGALLQGLLGVLLAVPLAAVVQSSWCACLFPRFARPRMMPRKSQGKKPLLQPSKSRRRMARTPKRRNKNQHGLILEEKNRMLSLLFCCLGESLDGLARRDDPLADWVGCRVGFTGEKAVAA